MPKLSFNKSRLQGEIIQQLERLARAVFGAGIQAYVDSYLPARGLKLAKREVPGYEMKKLCAETNALRTIHV